MSIKVSVVKSKMLPFLKQRLAFVIYKHLATLDYWERERERAVQKARSIKSCMTLFRAFQNFKIYQYFCVQGDSCRIGTDCCDHANVLNACNVFNATYVRWAASCQTNAFIQERNFRQRIEPNLIRHGWLWQLEDDEGGHQIAIGAAEAGS